MVVCPRLEKVPWSEAGQSILEDQIRCRILDVVALLKLSVSRVRIFQILPRSNRTLWRGGRQVWIANSSEIVQVREWYAQRNYYNQLTSPYLQKTSKAHSMSVSRLRIVPRTLELMLRTADSGLPAVYAIMIAGPPCICSLMPERKHDAMIAMP